MAYPTGVGLALKSAVRQIVRRAAAAEAAKGYRWEPGMGPSRNWPQGGPLFRHPLGDPGGAPRTGLAPAILQGKPLGTTRQMPATRPNWVAGPAGANRMTARQVLQQAEEPSVLDVILRRLRGMIEGPFPWEP